MSDETKKGMTEAEMRDAKVPDIKTEQELMDYIAALVSQPQDYGTCVYAMSMASVAAFYYVASKLGVTGFQAGCAEMDFLTRTRGYKHGFMVLDANDLLYPQYDLPAKVEKWIAETMPRLAPEARCLLEQSPEAVVAYHWKKIVAEHGQ